MKKFLITIYILLLSTTLSYSKSINQQEPLPSFLDGNQLLDWLTGDISKTEGSLNHAASLFYIVAMYDLIAYLNNFGNLKYPISFPAKGLTAGQIEMIVKKYLSNHPEKLHFAAPQLIIHCFMEAFPTPETKKSNR